MPSLIVYNANVLTQDVDRPNAEAFAVDEGKFIAVGDLIANGKEEMNVFHSPGEVPVGLHFVRDLMIIVQIKFV
jgi:hypothetical protein